MTKVGVAYNRALDGMYARVCPRFISIPFEDSKRHLQAALTGESLPVTLYEGDKTLMGSTVVRGETEGTVEFTGVDTFFGKTAALLASTEENPF